MHYKAFTNSPSEPHRELWFSDDRSPGELGAALAAEGYLLVVRGEAIWASVNFGGQTSYSFNFTAKGQTVLLRDHVLRIDAVNESDPDS
jgi:hypothetical protein